MRRVLLVGVLLAAFTLIFSPSSTPAVPETHSRRVMAVWGDDGE